MTNLHEELPVEFYQLGLELKQGSQSPHQNQSPNLSSGGNRKHSVRHAGTVVGFLRPRKQQQPSSPIAHFADCHHFRALVSMWAVLSA